MILNSIFHDTASLVYNYDKSIFIVSLRKEPTFCDTTTGFPAKSRLRNKRRNSILMTRHYPELGSASDWLCWVGDSIQPIRSTKQRAKKVVSDSPGLVDFAVGLVIFVLNLPDGQELFWGEIQITEGL